MMLKVIAITLTFILGYLTGFCSGEARGVELGRLYESGKLYP